MPDTSTDTGRALYIQRRLQTMTRAVLLTVAFAVQFGVNAAVLVTPDDRAELVVYLALAVVGLTAPVTLSRRGRIPAVVRWCGTAVLLASSVVMSATLPLDPVARAEHWSIGLIGWYGLVLLYDQRFRVMGGFFVAHVAAAMWPEIASGAALTDVAVMASSLTSVIGLQIAVATGTRLVRAIAAAAVRASRTEEELRIKEEAAATTARDHERRYADLRDTTLPLLAGLADGRLDPYDPDVRRRCAVDAAKMRRLFVEREDVADHLVYELNAIIDIAERHGVSVHLSVRGTPVELSARLRRDLLAPISEALVTAGPEARVTVLHEPDRVRVSVRCAAPTTPADRVEHNDIDVTESVAGGQRWLEASWRSRPAYRVG